MDKHPTQISDFLEDESFVESVINKTPLLKESWLKWLKKNPADKENFDKAVMVLRHLKNEEVDAVSSQTINQEWQRFKSASFDAAKSIQVKPLWASSMVWRVAASIILVLGLGFWYIESLNTNKLAQYGKPQKIVLPDGSIVNLNANSTLSYPTFWWFRNQRTVTLKGNAYFQVIKGQEPFIVKTKEFDVKVLGTTFEVNTQTNKSQVFLKAGSVALVLNRTKQMLKLQPNDLFQLNQHAAIKQQKNYHGSDWTEGKLSFENTSLAIVFEKVEQLYGVKIKASDAINNQLFTASLPYTSTAKTIIEAITQSFDLKTKQLNNDTIEIYR